MLVSGMVFFFGLLASCYLMGTPVLLPEVIESAVAMGLCGRRIGLLVGWQRENLVGGFKDFFYFHPLLGEMIHFD